MTTHTASAKEQLKKYLAEYQDHPIEYIALVSAIMALVEKEHPEEKPKILYTVISFLEEFTEEQFVDAINRVEKIREDIMTDKVSCNGFSKEFLCEQYDTTIAFMRYHFIDD